MNFADLSVEELEKLYRSAMFDCRYYLNTDDYYCWERETKDRQAANAHLNALADEYKRRGLQPPYVK